MNFEKNDLFYWYPKLQEIEGILTPVTSILKLYAPLEKPLYGEPLEDGDQEKIDEFFKRLKNIILETVGIPCFMRTAHTSAKHYWKDTCHLKDIDRLERQVYQIVEFSHMAGIVSLPHDTWVIREFLDLQYVFHAFSDMPIAREFRFFIRDGKVIHVQPYWPEGAIEGHINEEENANWKEILRDTINTISSEEREDLKQAINLVAANIDGFWSVDFAQHIEGKWYCIDMAVGEDSYIYEPPNLKELMVGFT